MNKVPPFGRYARPALCALSVWLGACAQTSTAAASATPLQTLIGTAACDSDAQCRTVPVGAKACGGPDAYHAFSTKAGNEDAVRESADKDAALRRAQVKRSGMASNCAMVVDPGAFCAPSKTCRLNDPGREGGASGAPAIR